MPVELRLIKTSALPKSKDDAFYQIWVASNTELSLARATARNSDLISGLREMTYPTFAANISTKSYLFIGIARIFAAKLVILFDDVSNVKNKLAREVVGKPARMMNAIANSRLITTKELEARNIDTEYLPKDGRKRKKPSKDVQNIDEQKQVPIFDIITPNDIEFIGRAKQPCLQDENLDEHASNLQLNRQIEELSRRSYPVGEGPSSKVGLFAERAGQRGIDEFGDSQTHGNLGLLPGMEFLKTLTKRNVEKVADSKQPPRSEDKENFEISALAAANRSLIPGQLDQVNISRLTLDDLGEKSFRISRKSINFLESLADAFQQQQPQLQQEQSNAADASRFDDLNDITFYRNKPNSVLASPGADTQKAGRIPMTKGKRSRYVGIDADINLDPEKFQSSLKNDMLAGQQQIMIEIAPCTRDLAKMEKLMAAQIEDPDKVFFATDSPVLKARFMNVLEIIGKRKIDSEVANSLIFSGSKRTFDQSKGLHELNRTIADMTLNASKQLDKTPQSNKLAFEVPTNAALRKMPKYASNIGQLEKVFKKARKTQLPFSELVNKIKCGPSPRLRAIALLSMLTQMTIYGEVVLSQQEPMGEIMVTIKHE